MRSVVEVHVLAPCYATPGLAFLHQGWAAVTAASSAGGSVGGRPLGGVRAFGLDCAPRLAQPSPPARATEAAPGAAAVEAEASCVADADAAPAEVELPWFGGAHDDAADGAAAVRWAAAMALRDAWQSEPPRTAPKRAAARLLSASALFARKPYTVALALYAAVRPPDGAASPLPPVAEIPDWVLTWAGPRCRGDGRAEKYEGEEEGEEERGEEAVSVTASGIEVASKEDEKVLFECWLGTHFELSSANFHGHAPTHGTKYLLTWKRRAAVSVSATV
jgi:hypothetical protein